MEPPEETKEESKSAMAEPVSASSLAEATPPQAPPLGMTLKVKKVVTFDADLTEAGAQGESQRGDPGVIGRSNTEVPKASLKMAIAKGVIPKTKVVKAFVAERTIAPAATPPEELDCKSMYN